MGNNLFGANISGILAKALGPSFLAATLTKVTPGTRGSDLTAGTQPTSTGYAAKGIVSDYTLREIDGTSVLTQDKKILLLGDTIASGQVPSVGDRVTIEGKSYRVINVTRDPDAATYTCQGRA